MDYIEDEGQGVFAGEDNIFQGPFVPQIDIDTIDDPLGMESIIKVIGVGGGGGNAVNHMYSEGFRDVTFLLCNTDSQALRESPVPMRLQLGKEGLGAGDNPKKGRKAAEESVNDVKRMLSDGTRMAFITAGMGGGTGTGAAPVIARVSKELGILTVGIVTIPFLWEGNEKIYKALDGVEELSKNVDALLVINNERLRDLYRDRGIFDAFARADETLTTAAKSIAEIITTHKRINVDFNDVSMVLKDGGVAIMSMGYGEGEGRLQKAIQDALTSPLLSNNDIFNSKKVLLSIDFSSESNQGNGLLMEEMNDIHEFMSKFKNRFEVKWGLGENNSLGEKVKITILATGFGLSNVEGMTAHIGQKITQQEMVDRAEQAAKDAKIQKIKDTMYGGDTKNIRYRHTPNIFLFSSKDLDNDDIIYAVESTPTCKRTKELLKEIRNQAMGVAPTEKEAPPIIGNAQPTISFT